MFNNSSDQTNNLYKICRPTLTSTQLVFLPDTLRPLICIINFTKQLIDLSVKAYQIILIIHNDVLSTEQ